MIIIGATIKIIMVCVVNVIIRLGRCRLGPNVVIVLFGLGLDIFIIVEVNFAVTTVIRGGLLSVMV